MRKDIFPYFDGQRQRFADPFAVDSTLAVFLDGNPGAYKEKSVSPIAEEAVPARNRIKQAVCAAFDIKGFDSNTGDGATEDIVLGIFKEFLLWRQKKNASAASSPILPASSASEMPPPPGGWNSIMNSLMDCGCTSPESATSAPTRSV